MESKFKLLDESKDKNSVISFDPSLFKAGELTTILENALSMRGIEAANQDLQVNKRGCLPYSRNTREWIDQGVNCEILSPGKDWIKGKLRIKVVLEFCPDVPDVEDEVVEIDSSLDDLRKQLNSEK